MRSKDPVGLTQEVCVGGLTIYPALRSIMVTALDG